MIANQPMSQAGQLRPCCCRQDRQVLLGLVCSSFIVLLLGLVLFYHTSLKTARGPGIPRQAPPPCLSPACLKAAERLSAAGDPFAQPCDYFLASCGAEGPAAATRGRQRGKKLTQEARGQEERALGNKRQWRQVILHDNMSAFPERVADRQSSLLQVLREILESPDKPGSMNSTERKVRMFYRSCMDTRETERAGSQPVLKLIQKLGGWAVSGQWNRTNFNVTLSLLMKEYSTFPFFSVYVGKDPNDNDSTGHRKYIQIDQPEFQIPVEWDSEERKSKVTRQTALELLSFHLRLLDLLGVPSSSNNLHTGMFMQLFSELTRAASPLAHRLQGQLLYQRMTLKELQAVAPAIDWLACLQETFHPIPVNQSDVVLLHNLPYIIHMSKTISKWQRLEGHSAHLHTYMILSLLHKVIPALSSKFTEIQRHMSVTLGDTLEVLPHWKKCVLEAEKGFDTVLMALMKERVGDKEAEEMIQNIYSSLMSRLSMLKWRDKVSQSSVLNKVRSLTPRLSINKVLRQAKIDQQYSEVAVSEDDYFSNYLQSLALQQKRRNRLFSQTTALDILSKTPTLSSGEINIPLGLFVPPFFHPSYPRAVNYGILGTLIAKEILRLLLPDIQSQSGAPEEVSECVWAHYLRLTESSSRADPPPLSPQQQQEIWVQHTALYTALEAYNQSLFMCGGDTSLSNLSYTHLLLASFSQNNCYSHPFGKRLPFEPFFLVTVICMNSDLCPKPMTCSYNSYQGFSQKC